MTQLISSAARCSAIGIAACARMAGSQSPTSAIRIGVFILPAQRPTDRACRSTGCSARALPPSSGGGPIGAVRGGAGRDLLHENGLQSPPAFPVVLRWSVEGGFVPAPFEADL